MSSTERKPRKTNYQTFYKDAIANKQGYVTKDGMWAAIPSNGKKFAIVHNGDCLLYTSPSPRDS